MAPLSPPFPRCPPATRSNRIRHFAAPVPPSSALGLKVHPFHRRYVMESPPSGGSPQQHRRGSHRQEQPGRAFTPRASPSGGNSVKRRLLQFALTGLTGATLFGPIAAHAATTSPSGVVYDSTPVKGTVSDPSVGPEAYSFNQVGN